MTQYIDKFALLAEIKKIEHETNYEPFTDEVLGKRCVCKNLLSFLDTLEEKESTADTFIEKAWDWIEDNMLSSNQQDKSRLYYKQFINYMKGE